MKKRYLITYDLNKPGQNYNGVIDAIKNASDGAWCHYWESSFLIRSNYQSASDIFNKIKPYLDNDDRIIVIEVTHNYQGWLDKKQWDYINTNIFAE